MAKMSAAATYSRNIYAAVTRACRVAWFGAPTTDVEQPPCGLNNESLRVPNAAGTGYVSMIKVNASDVVEIPTATKISAALEVTGSFTPTGGSVSLAGSGLSVPVWATAFRPNVNTDGTSTQGVAKQQFLGPVNVPSNATATGIAFLIGTTGGTDYAVVGLYDNTGVLLGRSASGSTVGAGTLVGTASGLQSVPFTAGIPVKGPQTYWVSVQYSGTTAYIRTVPLGVSNAGTNTAVTYTPDASVTLPTSFTAAKAPVACLY